MIFNPWGEINNLRNLIDTNDKISVYGVFSNKRPLTQHEIKLNIQKNDDTISLMTNVDEKTGFRSYNVFRLHVLYIYRICLLHLIYNPVRYNVFRLHVQHIYRFYLLHLLYNPVQFLYDYVIYKLKRYKSLRDLYLFATSFSTSMCFTFIGFASCT